MAIVQQMMAALGNTQPQQHVKFNDECQVCVIKANTTASQMPKNSSVYTTNVNEPVKVPHNCPALQSSVARVKKAAVGAIRRVVCGSARSALVASPVCRARQSLQQDPASNAPARSSKSSKIPRLISLEDKPGEVQVKKKQTSALKTKIPESHNPLPTLLALLAPGQTESERAAVISASKLQNSL